MAKILVGTTELGALSEEEIITLTILAEPADWQGQFDRIQVFRSTSDIGGPYEELTATAWQRPQLPADAGPQPASPVTGGLVNIVGDDLDLQLGSYDITITFTGSDPLTMAQVASQITAQGQSLITSYVDSLGQVVIVASMPGVLSKLTVVGGDAASKLSLPIGETAIGRDPRIALTLDQARYGFIDHHGSRSYFYRTRFISSSTQAQSDFTIPYTAGDGIAVDPDDVIQGVAELLTQDGKPFALAEVRLHTEFSGTTIDGKLLAGRDFIKLTDAQGRAVFNLMRGQKVTVAVTGTTLVRTITVPTDPAVSSFNFFDPYIAGEDVFRVNVPDLVTAERRTL